MVNCVCRGAQCGACASRLAHAPVAIARRHERDLGGALSLAQLQGHPPLSRRYLKPTPLDKLDQWSLSHPSIQAFS